MPAKRILVVDEGAKSGTITSDLLASEGYSPVLARGRSEALRHFSSDLSFEAVVLDIRVRAEWPMELLESLKAAQPEVPILALSSSPTIDAAVSAIQKGAANYLGRPLDTQRFLAALRQAVQSRHSSREASMNRAELERLVEARTQLLARAIADLERSYDITLEALGNALDLKDAETEGHSKRVTAYSIVLARAMNIDPNEVKVIARGAYLHDIGKMAIPDAILSKPGKLTPEEQSVMREHCLRGYIMLRKIPFLEKASEIVFSHQEHFDGSGYSRGLKGDDIPLGARIFSIADALDAITSDRPYRKARTFADARKEIERCTGTQFDPSIVSVYMKLPDRIWEDLRTEINQPKRGPLEINGFIAGPSSSGA